MIKNSNICFRDEGDPLYLFDDCMDPGQKPLCLYGIGFYFDSKLSRGTSYDRCNDGSYFIRVTHYDEWIISVLYSLQEHPYVTINYSEHTENTDLPRCILC